MKDYIIDQGLNLLESIYYLNQLKPRALMVECILVLVMFTVVLFSLLTTPSTLVQEHTGPFDIESCEVGQYIVYDETTNSFKCMD